MGIARIAKIARIAGISCPSKLITFCRFNCGDFANYGDSGNYGDFDNYGDSGNSSSGASAGPDSTPPVGLKREP